MTRVLRILFRRLANITVSGVSEIPKSGPLIIAANHIHFIDVPLGIYMTPRKVTVFSKEKWKEKTVARILMESMADVIYMSNEEDIATLRQAFRVLKSGGCLGMSPEGTRSKSGALEEGKIGVAYLASRSSAPVIPMAMVGQENAYRCWKRFQKVPITVHFGKALVFSAQTKISKSELHNRTEQIMQAIADILPDSYRGKYL